MISDEKVGPGGVKVRCKKCGNVIRVRRAAENGALAPEAPSSTPAPAASAAAPAAGGAAPAGAPEGGLDAELGQAFDHAFGDTPPGGVAAPGPDADATQETSPEEQARIAAASAAPAAELPVTEWYVAIGQAQVGPLPLAEVKRKWEGGDVGPDSLVWRPGMGDWASVSAVPDLAAFLAPVPQGSRQARTPAPFATSSARSAPAPTPAPAPGADVEWKPVGASALAALASDELAARAPEPATPRPVAPAQSLMDAMDLPDGGGVDPTGAVPLPIRALETTGEKKIERRSSVARGAEELRQRRSSSRAAGIGAALAVAVVAAAGAGWWFLGRAPAASPAPAPVAVAPATVEQPAPPAAAPAQAAAPAAAPAAEPVPAAAASEPVVAKAEPPAPAAAPAPAPAPAKAAPAPEPARKVAAAPARREPAPARREAAERTVREPARVAQAPAPARKRGDSVLDFESNDAALDAALGGTKTGTRSVYVPPAPGGGALPDRVTDSQVNEAILGRVSSLQQCVQEQKARDPSATGVLKMRWSINPDGAVQNAKCATPEYASGQLAQCLTGVLRSTKFPRSKSGRADVTFPIKF